MGQLSGSAGSIGKVRKRHINEPDMKLKCYCVTVMDNWTPTREFWTYKGALAFRNQHIQSAYLHQWFNGHWVQIVAPPSR